MLTADSLRLWSWNLFTAPGEYKDPLARSAAQAQLEQLEHYGLKQSTYKLFLQALLHAGADDPNLEFSLSIQTIMAMTGMCKTTVQTCMDAAKAMGHIVYTRRQTKRCNPNRRTKIYRISALDQPDFLFGFQPQLQLQLGHRHERH